MDFFKAIKDFDKRNIMVLLSGSILITASSTVRAGNLYWWCGSDMADNSACWSSIPDSYMPITGVLDGDNVYLIQNDSTERVITYSMYSPILNSVSLDATGSANITIEQLSGQLNAGSLDIGINGHGVFRQSGSSVNNFGRMSLGINPGSNGSYALMSGTIVASETTIGQSGNGIFTQSGGVFSITNDLSFGVNSGASGTYNLMGGTLNVNGNIIDGFGSGVLNIRGGRLVSNGDIDIESLTLSSGGELVSDGGTIHNVTNTSGKLVLNNATLSGAVINNAALETNGENYFTTSRVEGVGQIEGNGQFIDILGDSGNITFAGEQTVRSGHSLSTVGGEIVVEGTLNADGGGFQFESNVSGSGVINTVNNGVVAVTLPGSVLEGVTHTGDQTGILLRRNGLVRDVTNESGIFRLYDSSLSGHITNNDQMQLYGYGSFDSVRIDGNGVIEGNATYTANNTGSSNLTLDGMQTIQGGAALATEGGTVIIDGVLSVNFGSADFRSNVTGIGSLEIDGTSDHNPAAVLSNSVVNVNSLTLLNGGELISNGGTIHNVTNTSGKLTLNAATLSGTIVNNAVLETNGENSFTTARVEGAGQIEGNGQFINLSENYGNITFAGEQTVRTGHSLGTVGGEVIIEGMLNADGGGLKFESNVSGSGVINTVNNSIASVTLPGSVLEGITHTGDETGLLVSEYGLVRDVMNASGVMRLSYSDIVGRIENNGTLETLDTTNVGDATLLINNGHILGDINVVDGGLLSGDGTIEGSLSIFSGGIYQADNLGTGAMIEFIANLGGELRFDWYDTNLDDGIFSPELGDVFDIFSAETIYGEFDLLTLAVLGNGFDWDVSYILNDFGADIVRLSVVSSVPIPPAVWLFGSGLIGLVSFARRCKHGL